MVQYIEVKQFFNSVLNILNPWIAKFCDFMTIRTNQMIVLLVTK